MFFEVDDRSSGISLEQKSYFSDKPDFEFSD